MYTYTLKSIQQFAAIALPNGRDHSAEHCAAKRERGLTLIEIMIVLVILGLLISWLTGSLFQIKGEAIAELSKTKMINAKGPIAIYQLKNSQLPPDLKTANVFEDTDGWGAPIQYRILDGGRAFELKSLGADGKEGGTGSDADIIVKGP